MRALVLLVLLAGLASCGDRVAADEGKDARLQVDGARFFRQAMPAEETGPRVRSATIGTRIAAGDVSRAAAGDLDPTANAVAIGLSGDRGYWVVPAGLPSIAAQDSPTFSAVFALSAGTPTGRHEMVFRAVDLGGRFGPPSVQPLEVTPAIGSSVGGQGSFVISLSWNNEADLDLHVVLPSGLELFKRNRTEYQRPPISAGPVDPNAPRDGGYLDRDSNARCALDGQKRENAIWTEAPLPGRYTVRVDTFSLCGALQSSWRLEAFLNGQRIGGAQGTSTEGDLRFDHNRGGGVLALELDVP